MVTRKSAAEIRKMREAGRVVARAHALVAEGIQPGVSTRALNDAVASYLDSVDARASFKGYHGFPGHICASVNEEVVHGIPGERVLEEGDIVSVDIGAVVGGFHGDAAWTYRVGEVREDVERLLGETERALYIGIEAAIVSNRVSDISHAIECYAQAAGLSVVREFCGHGIGTEMHEEPQVPNYGAPGRGLRLKPGLVLAIEPMLNLGGADVRILDDEWTTVTADGSASAHFEHTVAVTDEGPRILTLP